MWILVFTSQLQQIPRHLLSNQGVRTGTRIHHFPQGQSVSKSVQSLQATILDQVLTGGQQRPNLAVPYTSFYIHPSTSSKHPCVHPPSQTFRYQHSSCPTKAFGGKQWSNSFSRVSAFENMLKACNHSSPPTIEWCLVLLRFLPAGQPEFFAWNKQRVPCTDRQTAFWEQRRTKAFSKKNVREIKIPQSANPRGDSVLKTNDPARREFF